MKEHIAEFGHNLKDLRKKAGYTRVKLAEMLSYSDKSIEKWESGKGVPPLEVVCRIAEIFGVTVDSLVYAQKTEIRYLLAIDGGGTKTEFLLTDANRKELARKILGPSNAVDIGIDKTFEILSQGIREVCRGISLREVSVFAGLAGGITGNNKQKIKDFLSGFNFGAYANGSDTENVLEIALHGGDGVAVIMGTGIIAFAQTDGERHRVGGWGYHIDKGGSGYNIASDAMYSALKYIDGREGSPILKELIEEKLGKSLPDSISDIHSGGKAYIASFAPLIFEAYDRGDKYASEIIDRNIMEVAGIINACLTHLPKGRGKVVICGGLGKRGDILSKFLYKYIPDNAEVQFSSEPVVNGALMLADKMKAEVNKKCLEQK